MDKQKYQVTRRHKPADPFTLPTHEAAAFRTWIRETLGETIAHPTPETLEQAFQELTGEYDKRRRGVSRWTQDLLHDAFLETLGTLWRLKVPLQPPPPPPAPPPPPPNRAFPEQWMQDYDVQRRNRTGD